MSPGIIRIQTRRNAEDGCSCLRVSRFSIGDSQIRQGAQQMRIDLQSLNEFRSRLLSGAAIAKFHRMVEPLFGIFAKIAGHAVNDEVLSASRYHLRDLARL